MDAVERIIAELSQRFGVSPDFGRRLRPLIERALKSKPEAKQRILDLVERSYAQEAERGTAEATEAVPQEELRILAVVAEVLHAWSPPPWLQPWGDEPAAPE